jgi:hypothetical protein
MTTPNTTPGTSLDSLKVVRDEIRLQVHLAGLDARTAWDKLERRFEQLEAESQRAGAPAIETVKASIHASVAALSTSLHEFKEMLTKRIQSKDAGVEG